METNFLSLFPCPVVDINCQTEFKIIQQKLIDYVYKLKNNDPNGVIRSNVGGWHSNIDLQNDKEFKIFLDFILKNISKSCSTYFSKGVNINIISCWANINSSNDRNEWHQHPGSDMSGCLWIKSPENCGSFMFTNPFSYDFYPWLENLNDYTKSKYKISSNYYFSPIEGNMILFPSSMYHGVNENLSLEDRISLAFNIKVGKQIEILNERIKKLENN
jgi:uncharacterized protein (TIGR02466 family)